MRGPSVTSRTELRPTLGSMRSLTVAALLAVLAVASPALRATDDPAARLDAMSRGFRTLDYQGVFTYEQGQTLSSHRIAHAVIGGIEHERVVRLDGETHEVSRGGHRADCEHEGDRLLRLDPARRLAHEAAAVQRAGGIGTYYAIEHDGKERVANRPGQRLRIVPRDPYRYGMTVVLDDATSLLLKSETTDGAGRVLERFQFVELQVGERLPAGELAAGAAVEPHPLRSGRPRSRGRWRGCRRVSCRAAMPRVTVPAAPGRWRSVPTRTGSRCSRFSSSERNRCRPAPAWPRAERRCLTWCHGVAGT